MKSNQDDEEQKPNRCAHIPLHKSAGLCKLPT